MTETRNPFRTTSVPPSMFADRERECQLFTRSLDSILGGGGLAVLGGWVMGKTSMMLKFQELAQGSGFAACMITLNPSITDQFIFSGYLLRELQREGVHSSLSERAKSFFSSYEIKFKLPVLEMGAEGDREKLKIPASSYLADELTKIWNAVSSDYQGIVVLIDEAQGLVDLLGGAQMIYTVFSGLQKDGLPYLPVLAGKDEIVEDLTEKYSPIVHFLHQRYLCGSFDRRGVEDLVTRSLQGTGVVFSDEVISEVEQISDGHPYFTQLACRLIFDCCSGAAQVTANVLQTNKAVDKVRDVINQIFDSKFAGATYVEQQILVAVSRSELNKFTRSELLELPDLKQVDLNEERLHGVLNELRRKGLIERVGWSHFSIFSPLFVKYVHDNSNAV